MISGDLPDSALPLMDFRYLAMYVGVGDLSVNSHVASANTLQTY